MTISEKLEGDNRIVCISGHIDSVTTEDAQKAILLAFQKSNHVIVDFSAVDYISSAGIRAMLIGQKTASSKRGTFAIRGASADIRKVFALIGFEKLLTFIE